MGKKKRKNRLQGKHIILISSIIMLNILGVSYGYWSDGLVMATSIRSGKLDAKFIMDRNINNSIDGLSIDISSDGKTITIGGEVSSEYTGMIYYTIENTGSIPVIVSNEEIPRNGSRDFELNITSENYNYRETLEVKQFNK